MALQCSVIVQSLNRNAYINEVMTPSCLVQEWQRQRRPFPFSRLLPIPPNPSQSSPSCLRHCCPPMLQTLSSLQKWFAQIISSVVHWVFWQLQADAQPAYTVPDARRTRGSRGHGTYTHFFYWSQKWHNRELLTFELLTFELHLQAIRVSRGARSPTAQVTHPAGHQFLICDQELE